jgi:DNA-binding MarR family transcriptional regulator
MQQCGLVERHECEGDGRGSLLMLTEHGQAAIVDAAPDHVTSVRRHFVDRLSTDENRHPGRTESSHRRPPARGRAQPLSALQLANRFESPLCRT